MSRRLLTGALVVILVTSGVLFFVARKENQVLSDNVFRDEQSGIAFTYPDLELQKGDPVEDNEEAITTIAQLGTVGNDEPPCLITIREESRFRIVSNTVGKPALDIVRDNLLSNYPDRFPEFELINIEEIKVDSLPAINVVFSYTNNQQVLQQQLIAVQKNDDVMIYLTFQSSAEDFTELHKQKFKPILETLEV